jgi:hemerythrin superfamily protein
MDPYKLLKADHELVSELFERIESSSGQQKLTTFKKLKKELDVHAEVEETIFYPALRNQAESRDITLEAYEEHRIVKELLAELATAKKPTDKWDAKLTVLKENVDHHVEEEEGELFDKAKDVLTTEQAEALGDRMAAEKARQGVPVSDDVKKPGVFKTVVKAIFGAPQKKTAQKKTSAKSSASRGRTRKTAGKKASKQTRKAVKKTAAKPSARKKAA